MKKILMYLSAFLPVFTIMWLKEIALIFEQIFYKKSSWCDLLNSYLIIEFFIIVILILSFLNLIGNNKKLATKKVKVLTVSNKTGEYYLGYYSLFILSLLGFSFTDIVDILVLSLLIITLGIVYIKNELYFMNPTINIFRSYIYEVEYSYKDQIERKLIISKEKVKINEIIDIEISDFEFTFMRKKQESDNHTNLQ